jgi:hypothetical protein
MQQTTWYCSWTQRYEGVLLREGMMLKKSPIVSQYFLLSSSIILSQQKHSLQFWLLEAVNIDNKGIDQLYLSYDHNLESMSKWSTISNIIRTSIIWIQISSIIYLLSLNLPINFYYLFRNILLLFYI